MAYRSKKSTSGSKGRGSRNGGGNRGRGGAKRSYRAPARSRSVNTIKLVIEQPAAVQHPLLQSPLQTTTKGTKAIF